VAMSAAHKKALAKGRQEGAAVRAYLEALEERPSVNGSRRNVEKLQADLELVEQALVTEASAIERLQLLQLRIDLNDRLERASREQQHEELEESFVGIAASYGERKGISYKAWREFGVPAAVLKRAGIRRTRS
jgi:hypothetical protein